MLGWMLAAQIAVVARAPASAIVCTPVEISVAARASGAVPPRIDLSVGAPWQLLRRSTATRVDSNGTGEPSALTEATIVLVSSAPGRMLLPAIVAAVGNQQARASTGAIDVRPANGETPRVLVRATLDAARGDTVYVGEQIDYVVEVQLNEEARRRLRRNPTFFPPEMPSVLAYDLAPPGALPRAGKRCFETLAYRRALFPLFPGTVSIAPATLTYSLPLSTSFFSREESFEARTESVRFIAVSPPSAGQPQDFLGAVGTIAASARADARSARMGDPVTYTVRLEGVGNVKLLPRPVITVPWAVIALGDERVEVDSLSPVVHGTKEFDWLLTPRQAGRLVVPALRYPFFDARRRSYEVAVTDPVQIEVAAASLASVDTGTVARLPIRHVLHEERAPDAPTRPWFWLCLIGAPLPSAIRRARARRRRAKRTPGAARLKALAAASVHPDPREVRRFFVDALCARVPNLASAPRSAPLARGLRRNGVTDATAQWAESLLEQLDVAAFSSSGRVDRALVAQCVEVIAAVDAEAVRHSAAQKTPLSSSSIVLGMLAGAAVLSAMPDGALRAFDEGVRLYQHGDAVAAQRLFARVAARAPRAVDAWANLGTAAWMRGDSAHAAFGWHRALRLDPLDDEVRERLSALQLPLVGAPAYVAPLPVNVAAYGSLAIWLAAWLALSLPMRIRPAQMRGPAGGGIVIALVLLLVSLELRDRSDPRGLGVLRTARILLDSPTPSGKPVASATAGEVGTLGAREGAWVRLDLDDARAGWIPVAAILPLDAMAGAD